MRKQHSVEFMVGIFIVGAFVAFLVLAFQVSGLTSYTAKNTYMLKADFVNVGDLKVRAPVTIAGVNIGRVTDIVLDPKTFEAVVSMQISDTNRNIPIDSTANIFTAGLLGANYISLTPGFAETYLQNGDKIERTNQALILQNLVGQLMFNLKNSKKGGK